MDADSRPLPEQIMEVLGPETAGEGRRLFAAGAVLDVTRPSRSVVTARVATDHGRLEQVRLNFAASGLQPSCTCGKNRSFCAHAVAVLLELDRRSQTDLSAPTAIAAPVPVPEVVGAASYAPPRHFQESLRLSRALRLTPWVPADAPGTLTAVDLVRPLRRTAPELRLRLTVPLPAWNEPVARLSLEPGIRLGGRLYSGGNLRRLADTGRAAGGILFSDFAPADQEILLHLARRLDTPNSANSLALTTAELGTLLRKMAHGRARMQTPDGVDVEFRDPPRFIITGHPAATPAAGIRVVPGLEDETGAPIDAAAVAVLDSGDDFWLVHGSALSHIPTGPGGAWLRFFLAAEPQILDPAAWNDLKTAAADRWRLPVRLRDATLPAAAGDSAAPEAADAADGRPEILLYLDWTGTELLARMEWDYGNCRLAAGEPHAGGRPLMMRNPGREQRAVHRLEEHGFKPEAAPAAGWRLEDAGKLWDFWRQGLETLPGNWTVFLSQAAIRARAGAGLLRAEMLPGSEHADWFELDCRLLTEQGRRLSWKVVDAAVRKGGDSILLEDGTLLHIPEEVRQLVLLLGQARQASGEVSGADGTELLRFARAAGPALANALGQRLSGPAPRWLELARRLAAPPVLDPELFDAPLGRVLRGYQKDGVAWLRLLDECGFHGILADEMGLGKTLQALAWLAWRRRTGRAKHPALIVCPTSLMENWRLEAARFTPELSTLVISGLHRADLLEQIPRTGLVITSYALLRRDERRYRNQELDAVILDEAQHIKNPGTENAKSCKLLRTPHRLILTGTPLENSLRELWSLFEFLLPGYLGTHQEFTARYEDPEANANGPADAARELATRIRPFILRRLKAEVCQELPPKQEQVLHCEMDPRQSRLYLNLLLAGRQIVDAARSEGWAHHRFQALALLTRLRQACCHPELLPEPLRPGAPPPSAKTELLKELVLEAVDGRRRIILFSQFVGFFRIFRVWLEAEGIPYEYLDGATPAVERQVRVDRFNREASIPLFLLSLKAGGTGLNLTGADTVIHYDQWWNPMVEDQATDRAHRIGQTRSVTAIKLIVRNTIEEKIFQLQQRKRALFNEVMAGVPAKPGELGAADLEFLFGVTPEDAPPPG